MNEAISLLTFEDDDEIIGLIDPINNQVVSKKENPEVIEDATSWLNNRAMLKSGKPLFKSQ